MLYAQLQLQVCRCWQCKSKHLHSTSFREGIVLKGREGEGRGERKEVS